MHQVLIRDYGKFDYFAHIIYQNTFANKRKRIVLLGFSHLQIVCIDPLQYYSTQQSNSRCQSSWQPSWEAHPRSRSQRRKRYGCPVAPPVTRIFPFTLQKGYTHFRERRRVVRTRL